MNMKEDILVVSATEWTALQDIDDIEPLNDGDTSCLLAVRQVLKEFGMQDRWGVALLHSHFKMEPDEIMLEFADKGSRTLTTTAVKESEAGQKVGTIWQLNDGPQPLQWCRKYCRRNWLGGHSKEHNDVPGRLTDKGE